MEERIGKHRVLRTLGQGGMGRVLLAESTGAGGFVRRVVLKQVKDIEDADLRRALLAEARVQATLVHRNIVPVLDLDEHQGEHFMVLEYVDGMDLRSLIARSGPIPWRLVLYLGLEIASALEYAHRRTDPSGALLELVHRDVSPANILLSWEGEVKLTDFGIAKTGAATEAGIIGNFAYMSPEQARGEGVDGRSDIYSLGVVLYEAITGRNPFRHKNDKVTLAAVRAAVFPTISDLLAPADLRAIIMQMMTPDRSLRFSNAARLREALIAVNQRIPDPGPAFARYLQSAYACAQGKQPALRRIVEAGRAFTRRLTGTASVSEPSDTIANPPRAMRFAAVLGAVSLSVLAAAAVWWGIGRHGVRPTEANDPSTATAPRLPAAATPIDPAAPPDPASPTSPTEPASPREPARTTPPVLTAKPASRRPATLSVNSIPWSTIRIDDRDAGHTPRLGLTLSPGKHRVRLRSAAGEERVRVVELKAGEDKKLTVLFSAP